MQRESKRQGIMLCQPFEEKRLLKWRGPFLVQPKLDGERCRGLYFPFVNKAVQTALLSSEQNIFLTVPHINLAMQKLQINQTEFDGELYCHGMSFEEIHSIVSSQRVSVHDQSEKIKFHIFDLISDLPQYSRTKMLMDLKRQLPENSPIEIVETHVAETMMEIMEFYYQFLSKGYEGIIIREFSNTYVRKRSLEVMKFKPKKSDHYEIIGFKEEHDQFGKPKNRLGSLLCIGSDGSEFSVGSGLFENQRIELWKTREDLIGKLCHVQYQHITPGRKVPRFPVFIEIIEQDHRANQLWKTS